jgi:hypothetical protein
MRRRVFYSFYYDADNWRVSQIRNIGAIEENAPASDNEWEAITKGGDSAIRRWIDSELSGRACTIVLIGSGTAGRKWINYEIEKSWNDGKGLLGIYIHNLKNKEGQQSIKGTNPFNTFSINHAPLSKIVSAYDPPYTDSTHVYAHVANNIAKWIEDAISIRARY